MRCLLDADTLIDYIQDRGDARPRITAMIEDGNEVALCAVTVAELYSGLSEKRRTQWESWLLALSYWNQHRGSYAGRQVPQNGIRVWSDALSIRLTACGVSTW